MERLQNKISIHKIKISNILYQVKYTIALFWNFGIGTALTVWRKCKIRTSFKTLISKKATIWRLKESQSNNKRLQKTMTSSYQMEWKTFTEASCIYHIHTGGKFLCSCYFWRFASFFFCYNVKKIVVYYCLYESSLYF